MGRWANDKRSGYGVLRNNLEGWRFLTLWKEDKKHGRGIFVNSNDLYVQCLFSFGQMIDEGLVYHEHPDTEEVRIFIGAIATTGNGYNVIYLKMKPQYVMMKSPEKLSIS